MSMNAVLIVALAAAVILVVGGGLVMYMAQLVKNAYELKIQINSEVDERLTKMAEELDKKSRWIKRDLLEEIEKIKIAIETDNARKFHELTEPMTKRLEAMEATLRADKAEMAKAFEADRDALAKLDGKISALRRDMKPGGEGGGSALNVAAVAMAARAAAATADDLTQAMPATAKPPAAPQQPQAQPLAQAAAKPAADPRTMSGFLPDLGKKR